MAKSRGLNFFESFEKTIKLKLDDEELDATLKISKTRLPLASLMRPVSNKTNIDLIAQSENTQYSLKNCDILNSSVCPRYIVEGDFTKITAIEVSLTGFSEWFDNYTSFELNNLELKKAIPDQHFCENISIEGHNYKISSHYNCETKRIKNRDWQVSEYVTIKISALDSKISIENAENLALKIQKLFSLLLCLPLSLEYVWLIEEEKRKPLYFSSYSGPREPFERSSREALVRKVQIAHTNKWETIFKSYFSGENEGNFNEIWTRLPTLFDHHGTWESEILGYVATLDAYIQKHSARQGIVLDKTIYNE